MAQSLFIQWVDKYFPSITVRVVEKFNDDKRQPSYLYKRMLTPAYNASGKWDTLSINNQIVMADVIAMDSSLPVKSRPAVARASGDIPKVGMELFLNEKQLTDLDTLIAQGGTQQQIVNVLFNDIPKVIGGVLERNERIFLEGLSTGVALVDTDNEGTGVRIDYGFAASNKRGVAVIWNKANAATSTPVTDIQKLMDVANANGDTPVKVLMDMTALAGFTASAEAKGNFAFLGGISTSAANIPTLGQAQVQTLFRDKWGIDLEIVNRTVKYQIDKTITNLKPWADGRVVFVSNNNVGNLEYSRLAEQNHPVEGVNYQTADGYILVSKYRENRPSLREFTSSQARVVPVINADGIYTLDTKTVQA